jgi:GDSL-like lipase/acylhydrolase family protein
MKLRTALIIGLCTTAVTLSAMVDVAVTRAASVPITAEWIGDSFTSGWGLPGNSGSCQVSTNAWPYQAMHDLQGSDVQITPNSPFGACGGYRTNQVTREFRPGTKADLVGFTFGGDDVGFSSTMERCIAGDIGSFVTGEQLVSDICPSDASVRNTISTQLAAGYSGGYQGFLNFIANNYVVDGGNMVVLGYPALIELSNRWHEFDQIVGLCNGLSPNTAYLMRGWAGLLNQMIGEGVVEFNSEPPAQRDDVQATFVNIQDGGSSSDTNPDLFDPAGTTVGHNLCGSDPWLNNFDKVDFTTGSINPIGFHPNENGAIAMGQLAAEAIEQMNWSRLAQPSTPDSTTTTGAPASSSTTTTATAPQSSSGTTTTTTTTIPQSSISTTTTTTTTTAPQAVSVTLTADGTPAYGTCPSNPPPDDEKWCGGNIDSCSTDAFWINNGTTNACTNPINQGTLETATCWATGQSVNNSDSAVAPGPQATQSSQTWIYTTNNGSNPWMSVLWVDNGGSVQSELQPCNSSNE